MMLPAALTPMLDASEAMAVMVELVGRGSLPDPGAADSIETIGWLEAPFDPARRLLVTGLHDAAVPGRRDDPLLPDGLRSELGLEDDRRRTARDRWVLATILGRDPEARFLVSRHDALGESDGRAPSRRRRPSPRTWPGESGTSSIRPLDVEAALPSRRPSGVSSRPSPGPCPSSRHRP